MRNLYGHLVESAARRPEASFIIEAETGHTLTYGHGLAAVRAMHRLLGYAHRRVALALPNGIANSLVWLGALTGGHTLAPLAPDATPSERARLAARVAPDVLVVERAQDAPAFGRPEARIITLEDCERAIAAARREHAEPAPAPAEGAAFLTTSGSTGEPKGVLLAERQVAWTAARIRDAHRLTPADRGLTVLPFSHVNAPVVSLCASLLAGGTVVVARRFSRRRFWGWVAAHRVTWASVVPTVLALLLEAERPDATPTGAPPSGLRFVRSASAPLPVAHLLAFERRFGVPVVETYGLSEAAATVAANPVPPGRRKPGSVGLPVGVEMRICRPRPAGFAEPLRDVAPGETGEVCVAGPSVIAGYAGGAEPEVFQEGWFRTGDLGHRDADGYLYITGRLRDVINRGGENIAPREIEDVLLAAPGVRDVAVCGLPDPIYGQRVVAYVVPSGRWTSAHARLLHEHSAAHLSAHKIPAAFVARDALPRTRSGKLQRHLLRDEGLEDLAAV